MSQEQGPESVPPRAARRATPELPATSYALLGLLSFGPPDLSGYELKQRADSTLRFFWVSPAMSQVYAELDRLEGAGLVESRRAQGPGRRRTRRFTITPGGTEQLRRWVAESQVDFPVIKHSVALRLFLGHLVGAKATHAMLDDYVGDLESRIEELRAIRAGLGDDPAFHYPALVAEWGQRYYAAEIDAVRGITERLEGSDDPAGPAL